MTAKVSGTREWSASSLNIQVGCENSCKYCFAKADAARFGRRHRNLWADPLRRKIPRGIKRDGVVMFPTTHDVTRANLDRCLAALEEWLDAGNDVLLVSKADPVCIDAVCRRCMPWSERLEIRVTIGSYSDEVLHFWEPGAPPPKRRFDALELAYRAGYKTSLSIEPVLDHHPEVVVHHALVWVRGDIWIGLINQGAARTTLCNGFGSEAGKRARELAAYWTRDRLLDLRHQVKDRGVIRWKDSIRKALGLP